MIRLGVVCEAGEVEFVKTCLLPHLLPASRGGAASVASPVGPPPGRAGHEVERLANFWRTNTQLFTA